MPVSASARSGCRPVLCANPVTPAFIIALCEAHPLVRRPGNLEASGCVTGVYSRPAGPERRYDKGYAPVAGNFHAGRAHGHARDGKPSNAARPLAENSLHIGNRHMPLEDEPIDYRCMAGHQVRWDAQTGLVGIAPGVINGSVAKIGGSQR